jgi:hypothetical protein
MPFGTITPIYSVNAEAKSVPGQWRDELHGLGRKIERQMEELKKQVPVDAVTG